MVTVLEGLNSKNSMLIRLRDERFSFCVPTEGGCLGDRIDRSKCSQDALCSASGEKDGTYDVLGMS
jgi:hypothetical protein